MPHVLGGRPEPRQSRSELPRSQVVDRFESHGPERRKPPRPVVFSGTSAAARRGLPRLRAASSIFARVVSVPDRPPVRSIGDS